MTNTVEDNTLEIDADTNSEQTTATGNASDERSDQNSVVGSGADYPTQILTHTTHLDNRNVIDHYKYWTDEAILGDLDKKRNPFMVLIENFAHDFNIGTAIRNANAFLAQDLWICGRKKWDRRGAVGTHNYQHVHHCLTLEESLVEIAKIGEYTPVVMDNVEGSVSITDFQWPEQPLMIFGQEQLGVSPPALELAEHIVYIPQMGSTRSLNVGVASGIAMYDFINKSGLGN